MKALLHSKLALSLLVAALSRGVGIGNEVRIQDAPSRGLQPRNHYRITGRRGRSKWRPHQGEREMARRIGGDVYQRFLAKDRVRRGLPAQK